MGFFFSPDPFLHFGVIFFLFPYWMLLTGFFFFNPALFSFVHPIIHFVLLGFFFNFVSILHFVLWWTFFFRPSYYSHHFVSLGFFHLFILLFTSVPGDFFCICHSILHFVFFLFFHIGFLFFVHPIIHFISLGFFFVHPIIHFGTRGFFFASVTLIFTLSFC